MGIDVDEFDPRGTGAGLGVGEEPCVERGAVGNGLVGRGRAVRLPAAEFAKHAADRGHAGGSADEQDSVDFAPGYAGLAQHERDGGLGALDQIGRKFFELAPCDFDAHADSGVETDHRGLGSLGQRVLGLLGVQPKLCGVLRIATRIDPLGIEKPLSNQIRQTLVEILAAEADVAVSRQSAEPRSLHFQYRYVEGAAAKIVDQEALRLGGRPFAASSTRPRSQP